MSTESSHGLEADRTTSKRAIYEDLELHPQDGTVLVRNASHADPSEHEYEVTVDPAGVPTACTCPDHEYRERTCKHMQRVALSQPVAIAAAPEGHWTSHTEPEAQGGERYLRCEGCGIEAMPDRAPYANHREGCEVGR